MVGWLDNVELYINKDATDHSSPEDGGSSALTRLMSLTSVGVVGWSTAPLWRSAVLSSSSLWLWLWLSDAVVGAVANSSEQLTLSRTVASISSWQWRRQSCTHRPRQLPLYTESPQPEFGWYDVLRIGYLFRIWHRCKKRVYVFIRVTFLTFFNDS